MGEAKKMIVDRIIPAQKELSLVKEYKDTKEESTKLSILFLPFIPGRKKQHCHVLGEWEGCRMICVSFKKKGQLGKGQGTRKGKEKQLEKKQNDGSGLGILTKTRAGQKNIAQRQVAMSVRKDNAVKPLCKKMAKL